MAELSSISHLLSDHCRMLSIIDVAGTAPVREPCKGAGKGMHATLGERWAHLEGARDDVHGLLVQDAGQGMHATLGERWAHLEGARDDVHGLLVQDAGQEMRATLGETWAHLEGARDDVHGLLVQDAGQGAAELAHVHHDPAPVALGRVHHAAVARYGVGRGDHPGDVLLHPRLQVALRLGHRQQGQVLHTCASRMKRKF